MGNPLTEFSQRRHRAKGGGGRLPQPSKVAKKYRAGRRKPGDRAPGESDDDGSTASDGNVELDPQRKEMLSPMKYQAFAPAAAPPPTAAPRTSDGRVAPAESALVLSHLDDSDGDDSYTARAATFSGGGGLSMESSLGSSMGGNSTIGQGMTPLPSAPSLLGVPAFEGSFVEADPELDNPTPSPQFLKSLKYSKSLLLGSSPTLRHNPNIVSSLSFQRKGATSPPTTVVAETRQEREARLAVKSGGRVDPERGACGALFCSCCVCGCGYDQHVTVARALVSSSGAVGVTAGKQGQRQASDGRQRRECRTRPPCCGAPRGL
jgi:hypothetical protein